MGRVSDAILRGLQNGGRKTTVGGIDVSEYNLTPKDVKHIVKNGMNESGGKAKKK